MNPYEVLEQPLLSEKSNKVRESLSQYTFRVNIKATKDDVAKAISQIYGVKAVSVQTLIKRTKIHRRRNNLTKPTLWKKAIVTLAEGAKIPVFEEQ